MKKSCSCILFMLVVSCGSYPNEEVILNPVNDAGQQPSLDQVIQTGSTTQSQDTSKSDKENFVQILQHPLVSLKWFNEANTIESSKTMDGMARLISDLPSNVEVDLGTLTEKINEQTPLEVHADNYQEVLPNIDLAMFIFSMANQAAIDQGYVDEMKSENRYQIDINQVLMIVQIIAQILELFSDDGLNQLSPLEKLLKLLNNPRLNDIKDKIESVLKGQNTPDPDQIYGDDSFPDLSQLTEVQNFTSYEELRASYASHTEYVYRTYEDYTTRSAIMSLYKVAYSQKYTEMSENK